MCSLGWHLMVKWLFPLSSIAIKQLSHLDLCQPYGLIFQLYIQLHTSVFRTVYFYRIAHLVSVVR